MMRLPSGEQPAAIWREGEGLDLAGPRWKAAQLRPRRRLPDPDLRPGGSDHGAVRRPGHGVQARPDRDRHQQVTRARVTDSELACPVARRQARPVGAGSHGKGTVFVAPVAGTQLAAVPIPDLHLAIPVTGGDPVAPQHSDPADPATAAPQDDVVGPTDRDDGRAQAADPGLSGVAAGSPRLQQGCQARLLPGQHGTSGYVVVGGGLRGVVPPAGVPGAGKEGLGHPHDAVGSAPQGLQGDWQAGLAPPGTGPRPVRRSSGPGPWPAGRTGPPGERRHAGVHSDG